MLEPPCCRPVDRGRALALAGFLCAALMNPGAASAGPLRAGVAKVDITHTQAGPFNDRLYARALVLEHDGTRVALVTIDAVAIGEIGGIRNDFLPGVRSRLERDLGLKPTNVLVNASHRHGVAFDVEARTVQAVTSARRARSGSYRHGTGREDRSW
ncbi:MAG: hypothetical protein U0794_15120 [Isosphaeraceae bacterium]